MVSQPVSSLFGARPRYALCHKWLCAEINPGMIHFLEASKVVAAVDPGGGEPAPMAVMLSSFPTMMYPRKGFSWPVTIVKRSAFVIISFAGGAWFCAARDSTTEKKSTRRTVAFVRVFI